MRLKIGGWSQRKHPAQGFQARAPVRVRGCALPIGNKLGR
jgi:hypothetical protein